MFPVWRKTNPRSDMRCCHFFNGIWKDGILHAYNVMDSQSNEHKSQEMMMKELVLGTEEGHNYLTLVVSEYKYWLAPRLKWKTNH